MQPVRRNLSTILAAPTLLSGQAPDIKRAPRSEKPKLAPSPASAALLSVPLAALLIGNGGEIEISSRSKHAPSFEKPKLAPSPSRRRRKASKRKEVRSWKRGTPPVVIFGAIAHAVLNNRGSKLGPKRRRRLMRAVARLEAFRKRHEGPRGSAEILHAVRRHGAPLRRGQALRAPSRA